MIRSKKIEWIHDRTRRGRPREGTAEFKYGKTLQHSFPPDFFRVSENVTLTKSKNVMRSMCSAKASWSAGATTRAAGTPSTASSMPASF